MIRELSPPPNTTKSDEDDAFDGGRRVAESSSSFRSSLASLESDTKSTPKRQPSLVERCYTDRFHGYWDVASNMMRSFDPFCDRHLRPLVREEPTSKRRKTDTIPNTTAAPGATATPADLFKELAGSCILLFGDSTDRHIIENWCPRWMTTTTTKGGGDAGNKGIEMWSPRNGTDGSLLDRTMFHRKLPDTGGWRCSPGNKSNDGVGGGDDQNRTGSFTIGNLMHYGVGPPPYWLAAHQHLSYVPANMEWGNSTWERITLDIPRFFADCAKAGHTKHNVVVVQSYLWDLSRLGWREREQQHQPSSESGASKKATTPLPTYHPTPAVMADWAQNATRLVASLRAAVPNDTKLAWRYHGPLQDGDYWETSSIDGMNQALQAVRSDLDVDFVTDYGAVLASSLARIHNQPPQQPYFFYHPPIVAQTAYLNLLLNAVLAVASADE
jgi:hypothetical protein